MRRLAVLSLLLLAAPAESQTGTIVGRVVTREGGFPLPYGVIALPELGREQFTDDSGSFRIGGLPAGPTRLRVRRLGYAPFEVTIPVRADAADTVRIVLDRIAVRLATVDVREHPPCRTPGAPSLARDSGLTAVYEQLLLNAEQLRTLSNQYPFEYMMEQRLSSVGRDGRTVDEGTWPLSMSSRSTWRYRPGQVVSYVRTGPRRRIRQLEFRLPTLIELADKTFIDNHCFHNGGMVAVDGDSLVRVDFVAAEKIKDPDVHGSIFLDAKSFQIRRSVMRLSRMPSSSMVRGMSALEVMVRFNEVLPSIPIVQFVSSVQRFDPQVRGVELAAAHEEQRLVSFTWLKRRPGDQRVP